MIDARNVTTSVSARSHIFRNEQHANLNAIVWLYRARPRSSSPSSPLPATGRRVAWPFGSASPPTPQPVERFAATQLKSNAAGAPRCRAECRPPKTRRPAPGTPRHLPGRPWPQRRPTRAPKRMPLPRCFTACLPSAACAAPTSPATLAGGAADHARASAQLKAMGKDPEARHKQWSLLDIAEKQLRARQSARFDGAAREAKRACWLPTKKNEDAPTVRDAVLDAPEAGRLLHPPGALAAQPLPDGVRPPCRGCGWRPAGGRSPQNDYSLTPGRYFEAAAEDEGLREVARDPRRTGRAERQGGGTGKDCWQL